MRRQIASYRQDPEDNDAWVAVLDCHHGRHLRHEPPLRDRAWVLDPAERQARLGAEVDCLKCDRLELPDGLVSYKQTAVFTEETLPAGLRRAHTTKAGVWGWIEVLEGAVDYVVSPPVSATFRLSAGPAWPPAPSPASWEGSEPWRGVVAPQHPHHLELIGPVRLRVVFLRADPAAAAPVPARRG